MGFRNLGRGGGIELEFTGLQQTILPTPSQVDVWRNWRKGQELREGPVTIREGSLFQYFTTRVEKDGFLRRCRRGACRTLKGWRLKPGKTGGIKKRLGSGSNPPENIFIRQWGLYGDDACVRSADPADVVVPHMVVGGNPLRASSPTAGSAPDNQRRKLGLSSRPA